MVTQHGGREAAKRLLRSAPGEVDGGERLPQKSTYFWPKPRTGVILMPLDEHPEAPAASA